MNEKILNTILAEICEEEISEYNSLPQFKTSLRHRLAMKRIFALFERNSRIVVNTPQNISQSSHRHMSLRKRLIIIFVVIICAALMTGFIYSYVSKNFHGTVYTDHTKLFAVNTENCPETIEYEYYLPVLPAGFEVIEQDVSTFSIFTLYKNNLTGQELAFSQFAKKVFKMHYNTENHDLEEIEINGHYGVCIDFSDDYGRSIAAWDNDDYILEIVGDLSKNDLINLAKSAEILEK